MKWVLLNVSKKSIVFCLFLVTKTWVFASDSLVKHPVQHPFLLITGNQLQQVKDEIRNFAWKEKSWQQLKGVADMFLKEKVEVPTRGGIWEQFYYSPVTYHNLVKGKQIGNWRWQHVDTSTGQIFLGDTSLVQSDYDGVVISFIHDKWAIGALQLGLAWQLSGDEPYAEKAKEILLGYAAIYPRLPAKNQRNDGADVITGRGKVHAQSLNEAIWLIDIMQAVDLVWPLLKKNEQEKIIDGIIRPAIRLIDDAHAEQAANIQCWKNAAMAMAGFLLKDNYLIYKAIEDEKTGFLAQLKRGVTADGLWIDISPNYHFYALNALVLLANAADNYGYPLETDILQKMFTAPVKLATSYLSLPPLNDSRSVNLAGSQAWLFEWAYRKYRDTASATVINTATRGLYQNPGPHFNGWGLLFGATDAIKLPPLSTTSIDMRSSGIGKLVSIDKPYRETTLFTKYNTTYYRFHTHPDDLSFSIYKGVEPITLSPAYYNPSPINDNWYKTSLASNSFVVNEHSQQIQPSDTRDFGTDGNVSYMINRSTNAYPLVHFIRTTAMLSSDLILVVDQFRSWDSVRKFDIAFHPQGTWKNLPNAEQWTPPAKPGYNTLRNTSIIRDCAQSYLTAKSLLGSEVVVSAIQDSLMDVIVGTAKPFEKVIESIVLYRRQTDRGVMAWCISLDGKQAKIGLSKLLDEVGKPIPQWEATQVSLDLEDGKKWNITINPHKKSIQIDNKLSEKRFAIQIKQ